MGAIAGALLLTWILQRAMGRLLGDPIGRLTRAFLAAFFSFVVTALGLLAIQPPNALDLAIAYAIGCTFWWIWDSAKAVYVSIANASRANSEASLHARNWVEGRAFALFTEFPEASAEQVLILIRDEMVNSRLAVSEHNRWATLETCARIQRTMKLAVIRQQRAG